MSILRECGTLPMGIEIEGVVHRTFEMRSSTVADLLKIEASGYSKRGQHHAQVALFVEQIVCLGTLPKEQVTFKLLSGLHYVDLTELLAADARLDVRARTFRSTSGESADGSVASGHANGLE